jgi:acyl-coenzyme A thioesterase PaaI-like protein
MTAATNSAERERLRAAVARILDVFVSREGTPEQFTTWAQTAETFAATVEKNPPDSLLWGLGAKGVLAVEGILTPAGVEAKPTGENDSVAASVVFGPEQEGNRGMAHGGTVAHAFDVLFGTFNLFAKYPTYTSELTIRYRKPVPINQEITFEGEVDRMDGRYLHLRGRAVREGVILAEADATMVIAPKALTPNRSPDAAGEGSQS